MDSRPLWLTDSLLNRARAIWPVGRPRLMRELDLSDHKARVVMEHLSGSSAGDVIDDDVGEARRLLAHLMPEPRTVEALAEAVDRSPGTVRRWLAELQTAGHPVVEVHGRFMLERHPTPTEGEHTLSAPADRVVRIGLVSDTHLGSRYQQLTYLARCYEWFAREDVTDVYHAGDMVDGIGVYRGQHAEVFLHSYGEQVDYAVEHYPQVEGITTHVIAGNHDLAAVKAGGVDPVRAIATQRKDIKHLGAFSAWITIGEALRLYLLHPDGGGSYAVSYRLQKIIESFEGGRKPHILVAGHWHQRTYVDARNVDAYMPGCFQFQTPYETRKALQPRIGALLLEITLGDDPGEYTITQRWARFLVAKEKDW